MKLHSLVKPLIGASVALWRDDKVLLIQRGREPLIGNWSFPGGRLEPGETLQEAAQRELSEETGLEISALHFVKNIEMILRQDGAVMHHIVLALFTGRWQGKEPAAKDDAAACRWAGLKEIEELAVTQNLGEHMQAARRALEEQKS